MRKIITKRIDRYFDARERHRFDVFVRFKGYGNQRTAAEALGITKSYLNMVYWGRRRITPELEGAFRKVGYWL